MAKPQARFLTIVPHFYSKIAKLKLVIEFTSFFFKNEIKTAEPIFYLSLLTAAIYAIIQAFPPIKYSRKSRVTDLEIEIRVNPLLEEKNDIAIVSSDCFDTETPSIIPSTSLKGKLVNNYFNGDNKILDGLIDTSLVEQNVEGIFDKSKQFGKPFRYPIGTVALVPLNEKMAYLTVTSVIHSDKRISISKENLWRSLCGLWESVKKYGDLKPISLPVWGAGQGRALASRMHIIQIIILSFLLANREAKVSKKLSILIYDLDYDPEEMIDVIRFIKSLVF